MNRTVEPHQIFEQHDHQHCVSDVMAATEATCAAQGLQLTATRRRVLEILLEEHRPLGAYGILERLREFGHPSQPPVAYRALEFLTTHGFAHKIASLNAYVACANPAGCERPAFLICTNCEKVAETAAVTSAAPGVADAARSIGFAIKQEVVEAQGQCSSCVGNT
ncbi:MAG: Fur family transcriptional regulator [Geminicoccus sp.]|nr:Fur family transcriptional regulator [Geminicoccus sp.]HCH99423.1 Fur family transcriptional regulator [Alphaproteobacteria bacterium]